MISCQFTRNLYVHGIGAGVRIDFRESGNTLYGTFVHPVNDGEDRRYGLWKQLAASVPLHVEEILERETALRFCVAGNI